ncbi:MAG: hypothetical protein ACXVH7_09050, partial [Thermoanaerobaculia bacterium]
AENPANPSLSSVFDAIIGVATRYDRGNAGAITRATRAILEQRMAQLADNPDADPQVRAEASAALRRLSARLAAAMPADDVSEVASRRATRDDIEKFLARPYDARKQPNVPPIPPGPPIGD